MTDAELNRYATLICDAIQVSVPSTRAEALIAQANALIARERARQPVKQPRGGLDVPQRIGYDYTPAREL